MLMSASEARTSGTILAKIAEDEANMISADDGPSKSEETRDAGQGRMRPPETLHLLSAVVVWLVTGTTISSLNKWIFAVYNFRYPLLLSALHMLTAIVVGVIKYWFFQKRGVAQQVLTSSAKCKVFLLSLTFCASIAFGNVGLNYVQLSFAQMIYTTTPIFTLAISSLVLGKQHHILTYTAMMPICLGASFSIMGEVQFDKMGCLFVIAATVLRGVKSIQQSNLLQEEKINSVFLLYLMAIPSFCILAVAALVLENWTTLQSPHHYDGHLWVFIVLSCLGSVLYNLASCSVISLTSAVTLHILGNLSVVGNLLLSQVLFGSQLSAMSCAGAVLTLSGMIMYQNSEFIVAYVDSRRTKSSNGTICTDEVEPYPGCTYETSSYLDPPQESSLELSSDLFSTELLSTEPALELYDDSEPWEDLYSDLEPPTILEHDLEASSKLYHDLQTPPNLNHVQEPHAVLDRDLKPSSEVCRDLKRSSEPPPTLKQDLEPSLELDHDLEPFFEIDHEFEPSSDLVHDLEPSSELDHDPEQTSGLSPDL
ncbi:hypothetical protein Q7C36_020308 [Tachysurus vachellii]|uniref:Sugar phosphate transporter domain-containing protein n=2 Tax=Tachysurus vachellii TaxID=175792 RepID=A0AA88LTH7_TACVA|nr:hypothetical protein Q7C36_020308 [Tachysurus vachellii]